MNNIVIEWSKPGFTADHELWLARIVEPHVTGNFATLVHMRIDGQWHLFWYPSTDSSKNKSFEIGSREKGTAWVEKWASHHGTTLRPSPQGHPGHCAFSSYEIRRL
ncbi:hypothetical protein [Dyella japonica]|nr:hypothetical protein [Dyella japonica]